MKKPIFKDLAEYRAERDRLRVQVRVHELALVQYRQHLQDPDFRKELLGNGLKDAVSGIRPWNLIARVMSAGSGPVGSLVAGVLGARARTFKGRMITWGLAMAIPPVLKVLGRSPFLKNAIEGLLTQKEDEDGAA